MSPENIGQVSKILPFGANLTLISIRTCYGLLSATIKNNYYNEFLKYEVLAY